MRLPKIIYENMPYCYFAVSGLCFINPDHIAMFISALLFYLAGAFVWCMRSNARRKDNPSKFASGFLNIRLADSLYEMKPFLQFGIGVCIIHFFTIDEVMILGFVMCFIGVKNLIMRIINRRKYTADLSFGRRMASKKK